jgi:hypothetical protein
VVPSAQVLAQVPAQVMPKCTSALRTQCVSPYKGTPLVHLCVSTPVHLSTKPIFGLRLEYLPTCTLVISAARIISRMVLPN